MQFLNYTGLDNDILIVVTIIKICMQLSTIEQIKIGLESGLLTTKGAIHFCLLINKGARPCELSEWLGLPASTVYANLRRMEVKREKIEGRVNLAEGGSIVRERPGAVYAVK